MRRIVGLAVVLSLIALYVPPVGAQWKARDRAEEEAQEKEETLNARDSRTPLLLHLPITKDSPWFACQAQGRADGKAISTSGSFIGGAAGGLTLGLLGTGIAVLLQNSPEPPMIDLLQMESDTCRYVYIEAYRSAGKTKKQNAAFGGGIIGTLLMLTLVFTAR